MILPEFTDSQIFTYLILPLLIFCARIVDQTMGILRIIWATKGMRQQAFIAGFFESFIWLMAISQIMNQVDNIYCYLAFAFGFATGNVVGITVEKKLSMGYVLVRLIFNNDASETFELLDKNGFQYTNTEASGRNGEVCMAFCTVKRKRLNDFLNIVNQTNPAVFYTVEEIKHIKNTDFIPTKKRWRRILQRK